MPQPVPPPEQKPRRSAWRTAGAVAVALISAIYLVNPTLGVFELLPDVLPIVGNLDEAFFTLALVSSLAALGIELPMLRRR
ncbi:MAG: DUF1232 domain-containing protein [Planctomycetota bacterium]